MTETYSQIRSGDFATRRRDGISLTDIHFIRDKLWEGASIQAVANMLARPVADIALVAATLPRGPRKEYRHPKEPVTFMLGHPPQPTQIETIAARVAKKHGLTIPDLRGKGVRRDVARARQEAMWEARKTGRLTLKQIGIYFGNRDHTTVLHAVQAHEHRASGGSQ